MTTEILTSDINLPQNTHEINGVPIHTILQPAELSTNNVTKLLSARGKNLLNLMTVADQIRELQVGDQVSFVINSNINFTNVCIGSCKFCSFKVTPHDINAVKLTMDEVRAKVELAKQIGATEICMQGGLSPKLTLEYYIDLLRTIKHVDSKIHIHAFSPEEILFISKQNNKKPVEILTILKENGLNSMPGTAAEILVDEVRQKIAPRKLTTAQWIDIITAAHLLEIPTTATMMYGHIETTTHIAHHLRILRDIQMQTSKITEFVPLPFIYQNTDLYNKMHSKAGSTGFEDLAVYSTARIFLGDIIPHIQSSWVKLGTKFAQVLLLGGVDDLGGTLMEEAISASAGARNGNYLPQSEFIRLIKDTGRTAVQRDTMYNIIHRY